ncbi:MAG: hypothetical protein KGK02_05600 [Rhodospirillales bacterium]|nr:hypothetical protein [Rhodospirillales bacterium]
MTQQESANMTKKDKIKMKLSLPIGLALLSLSGSLPAAADSAGMPPVLIKQIVIPNVKPGDFDQMAYDLKRNRLYVSVEASNFIAIFSLKSGKYLKEINGIKLPHRLAVEEDSGNLIAVSGGNDQVNLYNPEGKLLTSVPTGVFPDGGILEKNKNVFWVGSRLGAATEPKSQLQEIDLSTMHVISTINLPASTLKDEIIDKARDVLFVSMRDTNQVAVIDLKTNTISAIWSPPGLTKPVPLALDQAEHLLFVGGRVPGKLFVLDSDTGQVLQKLDSGNISDSMWFDKANQQIYVSTHTGLNVYRVDGRKVVPVVTIDNKEGKSSLLVDELQQLYVAAPVVNGGEAKLMIYKVN